MWQKLQIPRGAICVCVCDMCVTRYYWASVRVKRKTSANSSSIEAMSAKHAVSVDSRTRVSQLPGLNFTVCVSGAVYCKLITRLWLCSADGFAIVADLIVWYRFTCKATPNN